MEARLSLPWTHADPPGAEPPWWQFLYDETLADLFLARTDPAELQSTLDLLWDRLGLSPGAIVFDQCCGIGTLAIPLSLRGVRVIGVDQCGPYIERARREAVQAGAAGTTCEFHQGDAFRFLPDRPCDAALNWRTGFGNAPDDEQNLLMLRCAFAALRPGGAFALDFQNVSGVLRGFKECMVCRGTVKRPGPHDSQDDSHGQVVLLRESSVDLGRGLLLQTWTYFLPCGERRVRHSAVRLYLPHVLGQMLHRCGFRDIQFFGDVSGAPLHLDSPRCIVVSRRPPLPDPRP